ncbi:MAG: hypothetical protein ACP5U1_03375 [Desulfomonilaceae bacterium]
MNRYEKSTKMGVLKSFLEIPLGSADGIFDRFMEIHGAIYRGVGLERFLFVRGFRQNKVLLVAHGDTIWDHEYGSDPGQTHDIQINNGKISATDPECGLGADDRAKCVMLWLLKNMGHSLLITNGEEKGQLGAAWLMNHNNDIADEINRDHQFVVQLDRRNGADFKCYNVGTDGFRFYVADKTGYAQPDRRSSTDIKTLCREIPGVNLSIGYHREHDKGEYLDVAQWEHTLERVAMWLSEENLPKFALPARGYDLNELSR